MERPSCVVSDEWRKAVISSVRAWLGQALTNEDAVVRQLHFLSQLLLFSYCPIVQLLLFYSFEYKLKYIYCCVFKFLILIYVCLYFN